MENTVTVQRDDGLFKCSLPEIPHVEWLIATPNSWGSWVEGRSMERQTWTAHECLLPKRWPVFHSAHLWHVYRYGTLLRKCLHFCSRVHWQTISRWRKFFHSRNLFRHAFHLQLYLVELAYLSTVLRRILQDKIQRNKADFCTKSTHTNIWL